jgi:hypothetical protein
VRARVHADETPGGSAHWGRNADYDWDAFDSDWYLKANYLALGEDDRQLLGLTAGFFDSIPATVPLRGLDVGSGTNLYPALAMLPLCRTITLREYSETNYRWLDAQVRSYGPAWDQYWSALATIPRYARLGGDPRAAVAERVTVELGSVFDLAQRRFEIGTMFFVAESITGDREEFAAATQAFVNSLVTGAPFAAAFMRHSEGYWVDDRGFPAVRVDETYVADCLSGVASQVMVHVVPSVQLRHGYDGMILATGFAKS